jgi:hypothetical protein
VGPQGPQGDAGLPYPQAYNIFGTGPFTIFTGGDFTVTTSAANTFTVTFTGTSVFLGVAFLYPSSCLAQPDPMSQKNTVLVTNGTSASITTCGNSVPSNVTIDVYDYSINHNYEFECVQPYTNANVCQQVF